jgi:hypothetical protein
MRRQVSAVHRGREQEVSFGFDLRAPVRDQEGEGGGLCQPASLIGRGQEGTFMSKQLKYVATAAFVMSLTVASTATAQGLGFTIDPTQGIPGDTVSGQVNPDDVAAQCVTTVEGLQAVFQELLAGPFVGGNTEGELTQKFFPDPNNIIYENLGQISYVLTLFTILGIAENINGATETALPQTFVMTFADLATQDPIGELGHFDPVTGEGSVVVPDLDPGVHPVVATCVTPTFDLVLLEAGIREGAEFLMAIGYQFDVGSEDGPLSPAAIAFMQDFLDSDLEGFDLFIAFLGAIGPDLLQPIVVPDALGLQFFTVLDQPETKADCKKGGWQQFPGLGFTDQGDCITFVNTGVRPTTTTTAPTTTTTTTSTTTTTIGSPSGAFLEDAANLLD